MAAARVRVGGGQPRQRGEQPVVGAGACLRWRGRHRRVGRAPHGGAAGGGAWREDLRGRGARGEKRSAAISTVNSRVEAGQRPRGR
jgi:hypothetical protein